MSKQARVSSVIDVVNHTPRSVNYPTNSHGRPLFCSELFGQHVFGMRELQRALPKPVFARFRSQINGRDPLDRASADAIAHAVRVWAQEHGATHFTHWFQPQTGATAEKHDSFLTLISGPDGPHALDTFSGSQLLQSEPDASSFPSGGMRSTFEARGYTVWDISSPMFIRPSAIVGAFTLYIPCVFISYNGEALDEKTILLRSQETLDRNVRRLLKLIGSQCDRVSTKLGCEQEYFLIDRGLYSMRMDLKLTGRTLLGCVPPKHQQLEDHYFGRIPSRVLATMSEAELELLRLGVPVKTRHNEVAPCQFELAPIFEDAAVAIDHNLLVMEVLHRVAHRHKLKAIFHEKPFAGVNGSGKHCNWSIATDTDENLLEPTNEPEKNNRFLFSLLATILGVYRHQGVLRAAISSASNDHRLGANEAPPAIISAFLGQQLDEVLNAIDEDRPVCQPASKKACLKLGGKTLDLEVAVLPTIQRDPTDRNRTSPLAFTGNKFEFRAVGSRQSPSFPVTMLNAAAAAGFEEAYGMLEKAMAASAEKDAKVAPEEVQRAVIKELIKLTKNVRYEGDNYNEKWRTEAKRRGLIAVKTTPEAYDLLLTPESRKMLCQTTAILSDSELSSRHHVLIERYSKDILIEANTMCHMIEQLILPAAFEYRKTLADAVVAIKQVVVCDTEIPEKRLLLKSSPIVAALQDNVEALAKAIAVVSQLNDPVEMARRACAEIVPVMQETRANADALEGVVADKFWPLPKYTEILFS